MSIKDDLRKKGMDLLADPRVAKLMQNEQFLKAVVGLSEVPGKVEGFTTEQSERFAKSLRLGTAREVRELRRSVQRLEKELSRLSARLDEPS